METLVSIQNQLFTDWECLIIDDGGTDNTRSVIHPLLVSDKRFSYHQRLHNHKKGLPGCRNQGLSMAKGIYIVFFDDDDWIHPQLLMHTISFLNANTQYAFCQYQKQWFTTSLPASIPSYNALTPLHQLGTENITDIVQEKTGVASCTIMWRKKLFTQHFNETLQYAEEWELYTRILAEGATGMVVKEVLYYNRKHTASNTGEFWNGNPVRVDSKMRAAVSIIQTLHSHSMMHPSARNYLFNIFIRNRGYTYLRSSLAYSHYNAIQKLGIILYYLCFPFIFIVYNTYHRNR